MCSAICPTDIVPALRIARMIEILRRLANPLNIFSIDTSSIVVVVVIVPIVMRLIDRHNTTPKVYGLIRTNKPIR